MGFKVDFDGLEELEAMLLHNADAAEKYAGSILKAGAEVVANAQNAELRHIGQTDRSTGDIAGSAAMGRIKKSKGGTGIHTDVFPHGDQKHGQEHLTKRSRVRNTVAGFLLEHGTSNMPARPWISVAEAKAADAANEAMGEAWKKVSHGD